MTRVRLTSLALAAAIAMPRAAAAQAALPVQAGATIDRDSVTVGDVVRLTLRVRAPLGASINFPAAVDSLGPVQSLEPPLVRNGADSVTAADRVAVYRLAPWDVGRLAIRLGDVLVQTDTSEAHVAVPLPALFVKSVLPADSARRVPKPARALIEQRVPTPWWWYALAALAAVVVGVAVWWWRRRRVVDAGPTGDPYADALAAFARIERLHLIQAGEAGRHAALHADVLRRYLAARVSGASLAHTSGELLAALRGAGTVSLDRVERLLATVDPVKFARAPISGEAARAVGDESVAIVRAEHERATALADAAAQQARAGAAA